MTKATGRVSPALARSRGRFRWAAIAAAGFALGPLLFVPTALGGDGPRADVYEKLPHGDPRTGVSRRAELPPGDCLHCHSLHGPRNSGLGLESALFAKNDNRLCAACHEKPSEDGAWAGVAAYESSAHARSSAAVWPGPQPAARPASARGQCLNCHTPHGVADEQGPIPHLLWKRGDALCLTCHDDGGPARTNVAAELRKASSHSPSSAAAGFALGGWKAVERPGHRRADASCVDCHDPHLDLPEAASAIGRPTGLKKFRVEFGSRATPYRFTPLAANDPFPSGESAACLRCHAEDPDTARVTRRDVALEFHPRNASFHAVFEPGKDTAIPRETFTGEWTAESRVGCVDCHGSDDARTRGPHGSKFDPLLVAEYPTAAAPASMNKKTLCLTCHRAAVYLGGENAEAQAASRFNAPAAPEGHVFHSGRHGVSCFSCHESHGSRELPHLLAQSRDGGLSRFQATADGGRCATSCHPPATYRRNEGR